MQDSTAGERPCEAAQTGGGARRDLSQMLRITPSAEHLVAQHAAHSILSGYDTEREGAQSDEQTPPYAGTAVIQSIEDHTAKAEEQLLQLQSVLVPRGDLPLLRIPLLRMTQVKSAFSLADITDLEPFRRFGESIAADPAGNLRRVALSARVITGPDGLRRTELATT